MATITFLGTGNATVMPIRHPQGGFECDWQSNLLLTTNEGKRVLLDCGTDIRFSLAEAGFTRGDLDGVYISHVHADHAGGLEYIAFGARLLEPSRRVKLLCESRVYRAIVRSIMPVLEFLGDSRETIHGYFEYVSMHTTSEMSCGANLRLKPVKAVHMPGRHPMLSYGLFFENGPRTVFWTSDSVFQPIAFKRYYEAADVILQDCKIGGFGSHAHASIGELHTLPADIKRKMILYHYDPAFAPVKCVTDGEFRALAHKGMTIEF